MFSAKTKRGEKELYFICSRMNIEIQGTHATLSVLPSFINIQLYTNSTLFTLFRLSEFQTETKALLAVKRPAQLQAPATSEAVLVLDRGMFLQLDRFVDSDRAHMIPKRLRPCLVPKKFPTVPVISNFLIHAWSIKWS